MTAAVARPDRIELIQRGTDIVIERRWFAAETVLVAGFAVGWIAIVTLAMGGPGAIDKMLSDPSVPNFFTAIFAAPALLLLYRAAAGLFNRTRIEVSRERLLVQHGPVPWRGNVEIPAAELESLYVKARPRSSNVQTAICDLFAITRDGTARKLVGGPSMSRAQATFLKQEIDKFLRLKDVPLGSATLQAEGKLEISHRGPELEIAKRWFNGYTVHLTAFSVVWLVFVGFFASRWFASIAAQSLRSGEPGAGIFEPPSLLLLVFLVVGLWLAYRSAAQWLNRTLVKAGPQRISVWHGPLPWPGTRELAATEILGFQVRNARIGQGSRNPVYKQEVHAVLHVGKTAKLVGGFDSLQEARSVMQEIEASLGRREKLAGVPAKSDPVKNAGNLNPLFGRVVLGLFGFAAIGGGLLFAGSAAELYVRGALLGPLLVRVLGGAWMFSVGGLFLGALFRLTNTRVVNALYIGAFTLPVPMFILLALFGAD